MDFQYKFHHLGLAVLNDKKTSAVLSTLGYKCGEVIFDPLQKVYLFMCTHPVLPAIEVIFDNGELESPLKSILSGGKRESLYHICYEVEDIPKAVTTIKDSGVRIRNISPIKAAVLFGNRQVAFYYIPDFGIIELLEEAK